MFTPVWSVISAAGITLWPVFARRRTAGRETSPARLSLVFGLAAAGMSLAVAVASPVLADLASGGLIQLDVGLVLAFVALMTLQGVKYPTGTFLTDAAGLRFQAVMVLLMLPVNLGVSIVLAASIGPTGPVLGSVIGVGLFQVLANELYVRRRLRRQLDGTPGGAA
jgi:hypothetical protein